MDSKIILKFFADVLYLKGIIYFEEFEDILESKNYSDLDNIVDKMIRGDYSAYRKGEGYIRSTK